ncbi:MAG: hypothetical protein GY942_00580, partial [Aestuariibacter sp.]|nr:hypothetical protein [Aestuariibacter sp.]
MKRLIRFLILLPVVMPIHAEVAFDVVNEGAIRWECVEVVDGQDVFISGHVVKEKAIACVVRFQALYPDRVFNAVSKERLRVIFGANDAGAQIIQGIVARPDYPDPTPDPVGGDVVLIGDNLVKSGVESAGLYTITARGTIDPDDGSWWPLQTIAAGDDAQIIWRINTAYT